MKKNQLSQWEATSLMVGAGVGAGIMAVPFLAENVGVIGLAVILPIAWAASSIVHLMLAEVLFRTGQDLQIVELMHIYILRGRFGKLFLWIIFIFLSVAFLANLAAYVSGAGEIVATLTGIHQRIAELTVYIISVSVVFFGLKAVGVAEKYGVVILVSLVTIIVMGAIPLKPSIPLRISGSSLQWLALYGMVMYALWTFYSVPQVVKGLGPNRRGAVRAILIGLGINGALTFTVAMVALSISTEVTQIAILGITERMGPWVETIGSILILIAFVTSYWSVSLALADILQERIGLSTKLAWLLATLPSLMILWAGLWQFLEWLRLAAGATAIVVALITIPMYRKARQKGLVNDPGWTLGPWGNPAMLALVLFFLILMGIGSLVSIGG